MSDERRPEAQVDPRVREHVMQVLTTYMFERSVALTVIDAAEHPLTNGSGFCVRISNRYFIGTAAHVARLREDFRVFTMVDGPPSNGILKTVASGTSGDSARFAVEDVGWIELTEGAARASGRIFMTLADLLPNRSEFDEGFVHVLGSPGEHTEEREHRGRPLIRRGALPYFSNTITPPDGAMFRADADLYVRWDADLMREGRSEKTPNAGGMSGGGVWGSPRLPTNSLWTPAPRLLGLIRSAKHGEWIRATQIQRWAALLARDLPALAPEIRTAMKTAHVTEKHAQ